MLTEKDIDIFSIVRDMIRVGDEAPRTYAEVYGALVCYALTPPHILTSLVPPDVGGDGRRDAFHLTAIGHHQIIVRRCCRYLRLADDRALSERRLLDLLDADYGGRGEIIPIVDGLWGVRR